MMPHPSPTRLLGVDPRSGSTATFAIEHLKHCFRAGDLLVLNDSATLPASLSGQTEAGDRIELRLTGGDVIGMVRCVALGAGDWKTPTEHRLPPGPLPRGTRLAFPDWIAPALRLRVLRTAGPQGRLVWVRFDGTREEIVSGLYRSGRPIQYAHEARELTLRQLQTAFATAPLSAEEPSATGTFSLRDVTAIRSRGADVVWLTHAAGISSTGHTELDAMLPLSEAYWIPRRTVAAVARAIRSGRVIAGGTSVARALETVGQRFRGASSELKGLTRLRIGPDHRPRVVRGLLTGIHDPTESHHRLLEAFAPAPLLAKADKRADEEGYRRHEAGDRMLILDGILAAKHAIAS